MSKSIQFTLNLPPSAADVLNQLAAERGLTRTAVIRQALGYLQVAHEAAKDRKWIGVTSDREGLDTVLVAPL